MLPTTMEQMQQEQEALARFVCQLTLELSKSIDYKLKNGWGDKIRESIKEAMKQIEPRPNLYYRIQLLKEVWENGSRLKSLSRRNTISKRQVKEMRDMTRNKKGEDTLSSFVVK